VLAVVRAFVRQGEELYAVNDLRDCSAQMVNRELNQVRCQVSTVSLNEISYMIRASVDYAVAYEIPDDRISRVAEMLVVLVF